MLANAHLVNPIRTTSSCVVKLITTRAGMPANSGGPSSLTRPPCDAAEHHRSGAVPDVVPDEICSETVGDNLGMYW